ncbi:MAG: hypothetical protein HY006_04355 [Candidatus Sungbacteria bacterium]|nr:hypothetical protein [Candidatus Sungbacteria bacterium]
MRKILLHFSNNSKAVPTYRNCFCVCHGNPVINQKEKVDIKNFADSTLSIYQMAKYFAVEKRRGWLDNYDLDDSFYKFPSYGYLDFYQEAFEQIVRPYNLFRNYLTKKPYNVNKWPLYFENPTLADGWDKNKEEHNSAIIFRKDKRYYLGIMHYKHKDIFTDKYGKEFMGDDFEKLVYRQIANPFMDIHNLALLPNGTAERFTSMEKKRKYWPSEITKIKEKKSYAKENFNRDDFEVFVEYFKKCAKLYWSDFTFSFSPTSKYKNIKNFTDEIDNAGYKISFEKDTISEAYLHQKNAAGELFLFEIHNKDWNLKDARPKVGSKNLHTLYFEQLFSKENERENFPFKLNGEAELFFRPATKVDKLGYREIDGKVLINKKGEKVIKTYRYSKDKIFLHCPITLNRVSENKTKYEIDKQARETLAEHAEMNIIGLDRGEKNLIYCSIIDQHGNIQETDTLNAIGNDGKGNPVRYMEKLEKRAKEREESRRDWKDIEAIKDIKQGYISQVVYKLAEMIIRQKAFVVLEDLNMRFKQIQGGIEKSVYQQLEKALIDKLSFLVRKGEKDPAQAGHILRAYQLAAPFTAFKDMGKQTGVVFYTQAGYTSKTCPECGFHRNAKFQFENIEQAKNLLRDFEAITYNSVTDSFTVTYSLKKFINKKRNNTKKPQNELYTDIPSKDVFMLSTKNAIRYKWYDRYSSKATILKRGMRDLPDETKKGIVKEFDLTEYMKGLFSSEKIVHEQKNISQMVNNKTLSTQFYKDLLYALFLLTETRHSISGTGTDYIQCPECGFDSRNGFQKIKNFNGDANGAYNIARKGIMICEKIRQFKKTNGSVEKMGWGDLSISIEEWDKFTQLKIKNHS